MTRRGRSVGRVFAPYASGPWIVLSFAENDFPFPLIQEQLILSVTGKKITLNTGTLPPGGLLKTSIVGLSN